MSFYTPNPWHCRPDNSLQDEPHFQVVDQMGAALFDSINRSPAADASTEHADMQLAAAAPLMFAALLLAREFISTERNAFYDCNIRSDGTMDAEDQAELNDIDQLLTQVNGAITAAGVTQGGAA